MILHNTVSGETTPLPSQGVLDYSSDSSGSNSQAGVSLLNKPFGCILRVVHGNVRVNDQPVREAALLYPGDHLLVGGSHLLIVHDNDLPPQFGGHIESTGQPAADSPLITTGIRWQNGPHNGHFEAIAPGTSTICEHVTITGHTDGLVLSPVQIAAADEPALTLVNGYAVFKANASPVTLRHGDVVQSGIRRFRVEIPGAKGQSAFSPSHPHNIQLSEEYRQNDATDADLPNKHRANTWLWVLGAGLAVLAAATAWLKTHT